MNKEYIFVGTAQFKTRDYIKQLEKENKQLKERIDKAIKYMEEHKIEYKEKDEVISTEFDYLTSPYYLLSILGEKE